jgi:hypothetical protein
MGGYSPAFTLLFYKFPSDPQTPKKSSSRKHHASAGHESETGCFLSAAYGRNVNAMSIRSVRPGKGSGRPVVRPQRGS